MTNWASDEAVRDWYLSLADRLDALEELVMKQHEIIGILINAGKRMEMDALISKMEQEMKEDEEED